MFILTLTLIAEANLNDYEITPHTLRHSYSSNLKKLGYDEYTISKLMGNTPTIASNTYIHTNLNYDEISKKLGKIWLFLPNSYLSKIKTAYLSRYFFKWRSKRDSNPRTSYPVYFLSREASWASWVLLHTKYASLLYINKDSMSMKN